MTRPYAHQHVVLSDVIFSKSEGRISIFVDACRLACILAQRAFQS
jgi:hypothetical protein